MIRHHYQMIPFEISCIYKPQEEKNSKIYTDTDCGRDISDLTFSEFDGARIEDPIIYEMVHHVRMEILDTEHNQKNQEWIDIISSHVYFETVTNIVCGEYKSTGLLDNDSDCLIILFIY